jgi:hypothetical protein
MCDVGTCASRRRGSWGTHSSAAQYHLSRRSQGARQLRAHPPHCDVYGDPAPGTSPPAQTQNTHILTCTHTRANSFPRISSYCARFFLCVRAFLPADTAISVSMTMKANESPSITVAQSVHSCSNVSAYHFFLFCRCLCLSTCHPSYHRTDMNRALLYWL